MDKKAICLFDVLFSFFVVIIATTIVCPIFSKTGTFSGRSMRMLHWHNALSSDLFRTKTMCAQGIIKPEETVYEKEVFGNNYSIKRKISKEKNTEYILNDLYSYELSLNDENKQKMLFKRDFYCP